MRVVHLTTAAVSLRFVKGHIRCLRKHQVEVHTISSNSPDLAAFAEQNEVTAHAIDMQRQISPWQDLRSLWQLVRKLREIQPHLVHAHTPKAGLLGMIAAKLACVPVKVYHLHGLPLVTAGGIKRRVLRACDRIACRLASKVYCVSDSLRKLVDQEGIWPAHRLAVLGKGSISGIDAREKYSPDDVAAERAKQIRASLGISPKSRIIGFVGRLVADKGVHELLDAWQQLRDEFADLHLLVVGPAESANAISSEASRLLANDPRIHCVGFQQDAAPYYMAMDVLAFPTYREGFGLVATEAAAMNVPVVGSRIPGCVDAVEDGVTGTLVPVRDAASLATALRDYLQDEALRTRHGRAGRERILRDFRPDAIEAELWQDYQTLMTQVGLAQLIPPTAPRRDVAQAA